jgi:hypothetical protein
MLTGTERAAMSFFEAILQLGNVIALLFAK